MAATQRFTFATGALGKRPAAAGLSILLAASALMAGCSSSSASGGSPADGGLLSAMKNAGCAKVALAEAPPFVTITSGGKAGGYLPTVTADVLRSLGVPKLCPEAATYDAMIPGLQAGRFDLLPGGLNITPQRCQVIAFSQPLTAQHEALAIPAGNPHAISSYANIARQPGLKLAVFSGSSQEAFALKSGIKSSQLVTVPDSQTGIAAVKSGRADAFAAGQFTLQSVSDSSLKVVVDQSSPVSMIGIGFRKKDLPARNAFDRKLEQMRSSGQLGKLYTKFGFPNANELKGLNRASASPDCK